MKNRANKEREDEMKQELKVGTRIYYTGDRANGETFGTIVRCREATKYSGESVDVEFDDERFEGDDKLSRGVSILHFEGPEVGRRFFTADEWKAIQDRRLAEMRARIAGNFCQTCRRPKTRCICVMVPY